MIATFQNDRMQGEKTAQLPIRICRVEALTGVNLRGAVKKLPVLSALTRLN